MRPSLTEANIKQRDPAAFTAATAYMRGISPSGLARCAYNLAVSRVEADAKAGRIGADVALLKYRALRGAYEQRKEQLKLRSFFEARGLGPILRRHAA